MIVGEEEATPVVTVVRIDREFSSPINMDGHKIVAALRSVAEHSHDLEEHKEEDERD